MKIWQEGICTRLNGDKFTVRVVDTTDEALQLEILDWEKKGQYSILFFDELDNSIDWID